MSTRETFEREIESLHDFFVGWYAGTLDQDAIGRLETALGSEFQMVTPDGTRHDRAAVIAGIREGYDRDEPEVFDIDIRNVELIERFDEHALVRYEEWQTTTDETTGRISTVLFGETADSLVWIDLHETMIE